MYYKLGLLDKVSVTLIYKIINSNVIIITTSKNYQTTKGVGFQNKNSDNER